MHINTKTFRLPAIAIAVAFGLGALIATPAQAAECGKHEKVIKFLGAKYKEQRNAMGLVSNRGVMEFFVSEKTGTWTVLLTNTQGIACIVAAGESFERSKPMAKLDPDA